MKFSKKQLMLMPICAMLVCRVYAAAYDDSGLQEYAQSLPWSSLTHNSRSVEQSAAGISPLAIMCPHTQAKLMFQHGFYDDSINLLERIVQDPATEPYVQAIELFNIGLTYQYGKKEYRNAIKSYERALSVRGGLNTLGVNRVLRYVIAAQTLLDQEEITVWPVPMPVEQPVRTAKRIERTQQSGEQNNVDANSAKSKRQRKHGKGKYVKGKKGPFCCTICWKSYPNRGELVAHKKTTKHKKAVLKNKNDR